MKNKILVMILAVVCAFGCAFGLAACDSDDTTTPPSTAHTHKWSQAWASDATHHWHNCTASGCTVTDNSKKDGYAAHDFSDGDCVCGKEDPASGHTHNWSQAWASDATHHWHNCTKSGCTVTDNSRKNGYAAHDFTNGNCVCGKEKPAEHSHNYKWVNNWDGTHKQHCQNSGCDAPDISEGPHTYIKETFSSRCDKCGDFEAPEGHTHDYQWKDEGYGIHSLHCQNEGCNYENPLFATSEDHIWGVNGICDKCKALNLQLHTHHWSAEYYCQESNHYNKCDSCNYVKDGEHKYPSEGAACSLCGHKKTSAINITFKENDDRKGYTITKFEDRLGTVKNVVVPCVRMGDPVTAIAADAFKNSNITSLEISGCCISNSGPAEIKIESGAFYGCTKLKSIVIPQNVVEIEKGAFEGCSAVTDVTVPFIGRSLDAENNDANFGYIFGSSSYSNNYTYVPSTLTTVTVTGGTVIADNGFRSCKFNNLTLPNGITSIGAYAFSSTPLENVNIPSAVTSIGEYAFSYNSNLTGITLPNGMQTIEPSLFQNCRNLADITIGSGIKSVGENAFKNCDKLKNIYYAGDLAGWCGITGLDEFMSMSTTLYINGQKPTGDIIIPSSVTRISASAFYGCGEITSVSIHSGVTNIGNGAFGWCSKLKSITVDENNTAYASQDGILYSKDKTMCIQIPDAIEGEITVPEGITHISFSHEKLTAINLPDSLRSIILSNCNITTLTLPVGITDVTIEKCEKLTSLRYKGTSAQWQSVKFVSDKTYTVTCLGDTSA